MPRSRISIALLVGLFSIGCASLTSTPLSSESAEIAPQVPRVEESETQNTYWGGLTGQLSQAGHWVQSNVSFNTALIYCNNGQHWLQENESVKIGLEYMSQAKSWVVENVSVKTVMLQVDKVDRWMEDKETLKKSLYGVELMAQVVGVVGGVAAKVALH